MDKRRYTDATRTRQNVKIAALVSVPVALFLAFLILVEGTPEAGIGLLILLIMWALMYWRFKGLRGQGLPPQS